MHLAVTMIHHILNLISPPGYVITLQSFRSEDFLGILQLEIIFKGRGRGRVQIISMNSERLMADMEVVIISRESIMGLKRR